MFKSPFDVTLHLLRLEQTADVQLSANQSVLIVGVMIMCYTLFLSVKIDKPQTLITISYVESWLGVK